jgi:hypothetical protein
MRGKGDVRSESILLKKSKDDAPRLTAATLALDE